MTSENYDPKGPVITSAIGGTDLKLVTKGPYKGWVCYRHDGGQWVKLRKATPADFEMFGFGKVRQG